MNIQDKVEKQVEAGFSVEEIRGNLRADGYAEAEIQRVTAHIPAQLVEARAQTPWRRILSISLLVIAVIRLLMRLTNNG